MDGLFGVGLQVSDEVPHYVLRVRPFPPSPALAGPRARWAPRSLGLSSRPTSRPAPRCCAGCQHAAETPRRFGLTHLEPCTSHPDTETLHPTP